MIKFIVTSIIPFTFGICLLVAFAFLVLQITKEIVSFKQFLIENNLFIACLFPFCFIMVLFFMFIFYPVVLEVFFKTNKIEVSWLNEYVFYLYSFM